MAENDTGMIFLMTMYRTGGTPEARIGTEGSYLGASRDRQYCGNFDIKLLTSQIQRINFYFLKHCSLC